MLAAFHDGGPMMYPIAGCSFALLVFVFAMVNGISVGMVDQNPISSAFVVTVILMAALTIFIARTQVGRAMRATSFDLEAASMMGIDVDRVIVVTFLIGSALAGAAGVMNGLIFQNVDPYVGFQVGLIAFTAAVVGGIGSIPGAMVGGLAIGVGRAFAVGFVSSSYQDVIVFAILIGVLLLRPSGIFGTPAPQKV
jgi:branched-chain amino acid transport system permease protein